MRQTALTLMILLILTTTTHAFNLDECFNYAGRVFNVSPILLKSIAKVESSFRQKAVHRNPNGTVDVGIMQINSSWIREVGWLHWARLKRDACYNIYVGAWILSKCIKRYGYTWRAVSCYNAGDKYSFSYVKHVYIAFIESFYGFKHGN